MAYAMKLQVRIDGEEIEGSVSISMADLQVALTKPYEGLKDGGHLPYLALPHVRYLDDDGQPTERARERAAEILRDLYRLARYMDEHRDTLLVRYARYREALLASARPAGGDEKWLLKQEMKAGRLGAADYQQRLATLRQMRQAAVSEASQLEDAFFEEAFPFAVDGSVRQNVLRLLDQGGIRRLP